MLTYCFFYTAVFIDVQSRQNEDNGGRWCLIVYSTHDIIIQIY